MPPAPPGRNGAVSEVPQQASPSSSEARILSRARLARMRRVTVWRKRWSRPVAGNACLLSRESASQLAYVPTRGLRMPALIRTRSKRPGSKRSRGALAALLAPVAGAMARPMGGGRRAARSGQVRVSAKQTEICPVVQSQLDSLTRTKGVQARAIHAPGDGPGGSLVVNEESQAELEQDLVSSCHNESSGSLGCRHVVLQRPQCADGSGLGDCVRRRP